MAGKFLIPIFFLCTEMNNYLLCLVYFIPENVNNEEKYFCGLTDIRRVSSGANSRLPF